MKDTCSSCFEYRTKQRNAIGYLLEQSSVRFGLRSSPEGVNRLSGCD